MDELIGKYLAGEVNSSEESEVDAWMNEHPENRKYFDQLKIIFESAASIQEWQQFDTDAAWNKVKSKLKGSGPKTISINRTPLSFYFRIAAGIVLVLSIGYIIYNAFDQPIQTAAIQAVEATVQDTLPDGSSAFLNKGTTLAYEFDPKKKVRSIKLEGEAFFDVKHKEEEPFIIASEEVIIEDVGTTFNVKAYPERQTVEVFVETGEVAFYTTFDPGLKLTAGETGIYDKQSRSFARITQADTNVLAYKTRIFNFYNADLGTVVENLNEVYETKIQLRGALKSCRLNVTFKNEPIESIAEIIAETLNLKMTVTEKEILLEGPGCE